MKHDGYTESDLSGDQWNAGCSCGWIGPCRSSDERAVADLGEHYEENE